jgi:hypothetical protein
MQFSKLWTAGMVVIAVPMIVTARATLNSLIRRVTLWEGRGNDEADRLPPNVIDPKSLL